ncbi:hypothetical protein AB1I68_00240 [Paenibacillus pabuli]|uniref:hypothetical protein n=1 Tax=Paenibacillus pabuli TaxID=1472 RepID=UPI00345AAF41
MKNVNQTAQESAGIAADVITYYGLTISQWFTLVAVIVTLTVGIINLVSSLTTNKRTVFVNAVTSERVKWMGQLRELLSEYLMLTTYYEQRPILKGKEQTDYFEKLIFLKNRIQLHLNPTGDDDKKIIDLTEKINDKLFKVYKANELLDVPEADRFRFALNDNTVFKENVVKLLLELPGKESTSEAYNDFNAKLNKEIDSFNNGYKGDYGYSLRDDLASYSKELVRLSSSYLKKEWERVKREAKKGKFKK